MYNLEYNLLKKVHGDKTINPVVLNDLLKNYSTYNEKLNFEPFLDDSQFKYLFSSIYSVLGYRLNDAEFSFVSDHFIKLLLADQADGENIDINWIIEHLWYFCMGSSNKPLIAKYKNDIPFIQEKLIKEYKVSESYKEKFRRKVYTKYMTDVE